MSGPVIAQKMPYKFDIKAGEKYAWCACGLSDKQPFCNGSHKQTDLTPVVFTAEKDETVFFCGCKHTKKPPYCDGTHSSL